jgi:DNA-binding transcriptional regulator LsrR (DeoR family)
MPAMNGARRDGGRGHDDEMVARAVLEAFRPNGVPDYRSARSVAAKLGISPQMAVTLLQIGYQKGLFSIDVHLEAQEAERIELEEIVRERFALRRVLLAPGMQRYAEVIDPDDLKRIYCCVLWGMARRAVEYLDEVVSKAAARAEFARRAGVSRPPLTLGVGWGEEMQAVVDCLRCAQHPFLHSLEVWPILGVTSPSEYPGREANWIAARVARTFGGKAGQLPCPAFVLAQETSAVTHPRPTREALGTINRSDVVIAGLEAISDAPDDMRVALVNDPDLNRELIQAARRSGAVGHISSFLFDDEGREVPINYRAIGLGLAGIRQVALDRTREVVLVAGGDKRLVPALSVALRTGLASVLVSETVAARALLEGN